MSFVFNSATEQQLSLWDSYESLTPREKRALEKSWARIFAEKIFPKIDEAPYAVLYSDAASRPNTPVNVIIGALILKEFTGQSDDDFNASLMFDIRYQYALHTTSFIEQPLSDRTLGRFRERCITYEKQTGIDLLHDTITGLSKEMAIMMKVDRSLKRMDSFMVESNIKRMSRLELLYTCTANLVTACKKQGEAIPEQLQHYLSSEDRNVVIYHNKSDETQDKITSVLADAVVLIELCGSKYDDLSEFQLMIRVLSEQTVQQEDGPYTHHQKGEGMNAGCLQNPADPDATYREKAGKKHRGYVGNVIEEAGENGSVVTDYQYEQNRHSDSEFTKETIDTLGSQEEKVTLVADGAYAGQENEKLAQENNIDLQTTNLTGKEAPDINADFQFNEDGTRVIECPNGQKPKSCSYNPKNGQCTVSFHRCQCEGCPYADKCKRKINKRTVRITISLNSKNRAVQQRNRKTDEFKALSHFRNGVETIPSMLRRLFDVDRMPVRGTLRTKFFFGCKIGGLNFLKLCKYEQSLVKCAQMPAGA